MWLYFARQNERAAICVCTAATGEPSLACDNKQGAITGECGHSAAPVHATADPEAAVATTATAATTAARTASWTDGGNWRVRVTPKSIRLGFESLRRRKPERATDDTTGRRR